MRHCQPPKNNIPSLSLLSRRRPAIKGLIISPFVRYAQHHALDYCRHFVDLLASRIFVTYWRRPDSPDSGHRCHCGRRQACHGSRSLVSNSASRLRPKIGPDWPCSFDIWRGLLRGDFCPEGGYRTQPRVATLGTLKMNEFALKGREADQINLAPIAAQ
jgi:hypothetical protein